MVTSCPTPHCVANVKLKRGVGPEHRKQQAPYETAATTSARTGEGALSTQPIFGPGFWPILGPHPGLDFNTATGTCKLFENTLRRKSRLCCDRELLPKLPTAFTYDKKSVEVTLALFSTTLNPARRRDFYDLHPLGYDPPFRMEMRPYDPHLPGYDPQSRMETRPLRPSPF